MKNTGNYQGKDVVQAYFSYPETALGAPARQLIAYKKTKAILPGESEILAAAVTDTSWPERAIRPQRRARPAGYYGPTRPSMR